MAKNSEKYLQQFHREAQEDQRAREEEEEEGWRLCRSGIECERQRGFVVFNHAQCHPDSPSVSLPSDSVIQLICVAKGTGLGLVIKGGANRAEGPMVFIQEIAPGGDCQKVSVLTDCFNKNKVLQSSGFYDVWKTLYKNCSCHLSFNEMKTKINKVKLALKSNKIKATKRTLWCKGFVEV